MENWVSVHTTANEFEAGIIKGLLENEGISAVVLNRKDSAYVFLGEINIMVSAHDQVRAEQIIKEQYSE